MRKWTFVLILSSISMTISAQTLEMAVQHSLMSNPDILQNKAKSLAAAEAVRRAEAAYLPTVDIKGSIGKEQTQTPITAAIGGAQSDDPMTRKETALEINQNIFSGFALTGESQRLFHAWRAQEFKTLGIAEDLVLDVSEKYLDVLRSQQLLMLARENLNEHKQIYAKIEERANAGLSRRAELEQARSRLSLAHANYLSVENDLRDAKVTFIRIVGQPAHHLTWPRIPLSSDLPRNLRNAIQKGIDNHPTLLSAHADILEAKAQHKVANAENYPKVDLFMDVRQNRNLDGLFGMNNEKLALVRLTYNLYRGGADLAKQRETAYQIQEAYELKNNTVLQIEEKVRLSWYAWLTAGSRIHYLKEHVDAALKTREAYIEQFKIGKRTLLDVVDSQNELYQAKIEAEQGHFDEVFARYRILNAEGALFPFLKGRLPVSVHNSDFATSHERINHSWLDQPLASVPEVDIPGRELKDESLKQVKHPSTSRHKYFQTTEQTKPLYEKTWFVYVKKYRSPVNALAMVRRLKRLEMRANLRKAKGRATWVYLGPFTFRSQAGLAMNRLQKRTGIKGSIAVRNQLVNIDTQIIGQRKLKGLLRAVTLSKDDASIPQILIERDGTQSKTELAASNYNDIPSPVAPSTRPPLRYLNTKHPAKRKQLPEPPTFKTSQKTIDTKQQQSIPKRPDIEIKQTKTNAQNTPSLSLSLLHALHLDSVSPLESEVAHQNTDIKPPYKLREEPAQSKNLPEEAVKQTQTQKNIVSFKTQLSRFFTFSLFKNKPDPTIHRSSSLKSSERPPRQRKRYRLSLNSHIKQPEAKHRSNALLRLENSLKNEKNTPFSLTALYPESLNILFNHHDAIEVTHNINKQSESNNNTAHPTEKILLSLIPSNKLFVHTLPTALKLTQTKTTKPSAHHKGDSQHSKKAKRVITKSKVTTNNYKHRIKRSSKGDTITSKTKANSIKKSGMTRTHISNMTRNKRHLNTLHHKAASKQLKQTSTVKKTVTPILKNSIKKTTHAINSPHKKRRKPKKVVHVHLEAIHKPDFYSLR